MWPMKYEWNYYSASYVSIILSQGGNKVMVDIHSLCRTPNKNVGKPNLDLTFIPRSATPSAANRQRGNLIRQTCENIVLACLFPSCSIKVTVKELRNAGGMLACAVNGTCMAMLNGGLGMRFVFAAVACAVDRDGMLVLDPSAEQLRGSYAQMLFVYNQDRSLIEHTMEGIINESEYHEALHRTRIACTRVFRYFGATE